MFFLPRRRRRQNFFPSTASPCAVEAAIIVPMQALCVSFVPQPSFSKKNHPLETNVCLLFKTKEKSRGKDRCREGEKGGCWYCPPLSFLLLHQPPGSSLVVVCVCRGDSFPSFPWIPFSSCSLCVPASQTPGWGFEKERKKRRKKQRCSSPPFASSVSTPSDPAGVVRKEKQPRNEIKQGEKNKKDTFARFFSVGSGRWMFMSRKFVCGPGTCFVSCLSVQIR